MNVLLILLAIEKSPLEGHKIKLFAALPHTHYAGKKNLKSQHVSVSDI